MFPNVLVAGKAGSGKDTVGDFLVDHYGYERCSFAAPLKEKARELWPDLDWSKKQRALLQTFGGLCRQIDPLTWVKLASVTSQAYNRMGIPVVITDCRYMNECDFFSTRGWLCIYLECDYELRVNRLIQRDGDCDLKSLQDASERDLDDIDVIRISNETTIKELNWMVQYVLRLPEMTTLV